MLTITPAARDYSAQLLTGQPTGTQIRLSTHMAGTPGADVALNFCPQGEQHEDDEAIDCGSFTMFVAADSGATLDGAVIDFESHPTGGELNIRAPGLRGHEPPADAPLRQRVEWVLESRINPMVAGHGGHVTLVEVTAQRDVLLRFGGGCHGCGMVDVTLKQGIETQLRELIPEIREVRDATDHSTGDQPYYR
ncbi:MAG: Fe-S biogenesis protein NfuA [Gammaproteobacteria bacterium HGW-Gammaproteobacteria-8]|nr:MAG: Fe-S biogenesis protein NfuA [Gammaproteobacteria bacterium HGW-Gammaproteobacteria-8]